MCENRQTKSVALVVKDVGSVLFKRSVRAKYLNIRIKPFVGVQVTVPLGMNYSKAQEIVYSKRGWIQKHLKKIKKAENNSVKFISAEVVQTRKHKLQIQAGDVPNIVLECRPDKMILQYPAHYQIKDPFVENAIKQALIEIYRTEAQEYLPNRLSLLAEKFNLKYRKVYIKNLKSRWGSCSVKNNINLNVHLMRLPDELIDYVLLHELAHTKIKNHSPKFWLYLEEICSAAKILDKKLNEYALQL